MTKKELRYLYPQAPVAGTGKAIFPGIHWLRLALPFELENMDRLKKVQDSGQFSYVQK